MLCLCMAEKTKLLLFRKKEKAMLGFSLRRKTAGFTLIELAIVLGIAGVLFGGVWRLLASGNQQMRDQAVANQHSQLIAAVSAFLQGTNGQAFLKSIDGTLASPNNTAVLLLPSSAANAAGSTGCPLAMGLGSTSPAGSDHSDFCSFLPPGTWAGTTNAYGQTYSIRVLKDGTGSGTAPNSYSFMIVTSTASGDSIPDTSGGRISAMIGGDGGFIYSSDTCGIGTAGDTACGSYGTWSVDPVASYGFTSVAAGQVASRTHSTVTQGNDPWLARNTMSPAEYNTMHTDLFLGSNTFSVGTDFNGNSTSGIINLGATGLMTGNSTSSHNFLYLKGKNTGGSSDSVLYVVGDGTTGSGTGSCMSSASDAGVSCTYLVQVQGDMSVSGLLYANKFYSGEFNYYLSDERLKKNIETLEDPLSDIMKLRPVSFEYKKSGAQTMGVIAQELEKVYPSLVSNDSPNGYKSVSYDGLIAPLIGAVQELKKQNDELKRQIDGLKTELESKK